MVVEYPPYKRPIKIPIGLTQAKKIMLKKVNYDLNHLNIYF